LIGCRRAGQAIRVEVWDNGPGIPEDKRESILHATREALQPRGALIVYQFTRRILPSLDAEHNVMAGAVFGHNRLWGKEARDLARSLLARVGLEHRAHMPVAALTYIDQKRIELARALAANPKLLLLDEWLAGLNPSELRIGIALIEELGKEGRTIIMVEHVMDAIRALCDRCVVMNTGRKIAEGDVAHVLSDAEVMRAYLGDDDDA
jgi:branched-chain amino acid transport system ATP-binding protein